jgi:hypothetical protein
MLCARSFIVEHTFNPNFRLNLTHIAKLQHYGTPENQPVDVCSAGEASYHARQVVLVNSLVKGNVEVLLLVDCWYDKEVFLDDFLEEGPLVGVDKSVYQVVLQLTLPKIAAV